MEFLFWLYKLWLVTFYIILVTLKENSGLRKEMCSLRNIVDQQTSSKSDISEQLEQLNKVNMVYLT